MSVLTSQIRTTLTEKSSLPEVDFNNVPFGRVFSDHMLVAQFEDGTWKDPEIVPYGPLPFYPSLMALNYGQSIFEGMKAFRGIEGDVRMFRPRANFERMNKSAARMSMQQL
ncbi:MAG: branched chain amino acid aminotransferase, partial [Bacteroidota bacterium]